MLYLCLVVLYLPREIKWSVWLGAVKCKLLGSMCHTNVFLKAVLFLCWTDPKSICFIYAMVLVYMKVSRELAEAL